MSGRRERPPSGRHNQNSREKFDSTSHEIHTSSSRPQSARSRSSPRTEFQSNDTLLASTTNRRMNRPVSAHTTSSNKGIGQSSSSPRIRNFNDQNTNQNKHNNVTINTNYHNQQTQNDMTLENSKAETDLLVQHFRDKVELEKKNIEAERTRMMGKFNAFSRPKNSLKYPLRSVLLDPEINNYPPSKTRSELMKKIKISSIPHPSYDIDGDGWVSQEDYKLAKRFDFDGNGVIDPDEREVAKHVIADEFFRSNANHIRIFGDNFASQNHKQNTESLEKANCFERTLRQLRSIEEGYRSRSSKQMAQCMTSESSKMTKYHYYTDKSDTNAYTDYEAIPRTTSNSTIQFQTSLVTPSMEYGNMNRPPFGNTIEEHHGSRRSLLIARREQARFQASSTFEHAISGQPKYNNQKLALISNYELEN